MPIRQSAGWEADISTTPTACGSTCRLRHFKMLRRWGYIGYTAAVGEEACPGVAKLVHRWLLHRGLEWQLISASILGGLDGARAGRKAARKEVS